MKPVNNIVLAGVSALVVLIGLEAAHAQDVEIPVAPLGDIEATYERAAQPDGSNPKPDPNQLDALERAIRVEMDARGGQPGAAVPDVPTAKPARPPLAPVTATTQRPLPGSGAQRAAMPVAAPVGILPPGRPTPAPVTGSTVELPAVPSSVVTPVASPPAEDTAAMGQPAVITFRPGTTELVAVAEGHLNRIVTPFAEPSVITTAEGLKTRISGNVVYVATSVPATIYITAKGDESVAIPLALVPRRVPPREIRLEPPKSGGGGFQTASFGTGAGAGVRNRKAQSWEESQPYVETIRGVMRELALGNVPSGYQIRDPDPGERLARCASPAGVGFAFDGGQVVEGSHLQVVVGTVTNHTAVPVELAEPWCAGPDVAAVAYWPANVLQPRQSTEVYVIRRPAALHLDPESRRPSLLTRVGARR